MSEAHAQLREEPETVEPAVCVFNKDLRLVAWNDRFFELLELPQAFAQVGRPFADFVRFHAENGEYGDGDVEELTTHRLELARRFQSSKFRRTRPNGTVIEVHNTPLLSGGFIRVYFDVSAGATVQDLLLEDEAAVAAAARTEMIDVLDAMADAFALYDAEDRLVMFNKKYPEFYHPVADLIVPGARFEDLVRAAFERGMYAKHIDSVEDFVRQRKLQHQNPENEMEIELSDGRWLRVSESRTKDGGNVSLRTDITELKRREFELMRLTDEVGTQNLRFDTALRNMIQGLCMFDAEQRLIVCNSRYLEMYGFSPTVVKPGITLKEIMEYSISLGNYTKEERDKALAARPTHAAMREQATLLQRLKDGRVIAVMHQPMSDGGSVATYEDVTDRENTEKALRDYATKLERSNNELQAFAYVASHDLQEPLRKIEAFGDRLKTKCADTLGKDAILYLDRMQNASGRMRALINDLLSYSRITTKANPFVPVDLAALAREVISDLEIRIEETKAKVEVEGLPTIDADATQMRQLLQNLISNALKFQGEAETPHVAVTGRLLSREEAGDTSEEMCEIRVADNGIGFDEKYLDRIFAIFQRLHGRSEYEGTGIGLATCQKIVEQHRGSITATSAPGKGATFIITLPIRGIDSEVSQ